MQKSPYTPGVVAKTVYGRDAVLRRVKRELLFMQDEPSLGGAISVHVGPRGIGKTSLLRAVEAEAQAQNFATLWITAGDVPLFPALLNKLEELISSWTDEAARKLRSFIEQMQIAVLGVSFQVSVAEIDAPLVGHGDQMQQALVHAAEALRAKKNGLIVCIDEIQAADAEGIRALAYAWQQMQSEHSDLPVAIYTAGLSHTQDVITDVVSFAERFNYNSLESLDTRAAVEALLSPARKLGVEWSSSTLESAVELARGYPYFIQVIGDAVWEVADFPDPGTTIGLSSMSDVREQFETVQTTLFRSRWQKATDVEKSFLAAMAEDEGEPSKRADIARRMGRNTSSISMARRSLLDKGIIDESGYGYLAFSVPGFDAFVRREYPAGT